MRTEPRRGFTLLEVVVALTIGSAVLVVARELTHGVVRQSAEVLVAADAQRQRMVWQRAVRLSLDRLRTSTDATDLAQGDSVHLEIPTWCDGDAGWLEPCTASVRVSGEQESSGMHGRVVQLAHQLSVILPSSYTIRYLWSAQEGGQWVARWDPTRRAPLAVQVIGVGDTLLLGVHQP